MNRRIRNIIGDFYLVIMLLFLYLPIFTMIVLSFNESKSRTRWGGFPAGGSEGGCTIPP